MRGEFRLRRLEDGERIGGAAEVKQATAVGGDRLVVAGAEAEEVAELVIAATEPLRRSETLEALVGIRGDGSLITPREPRQGRRGGLCLGAGRCARTRRSRDTAAASPARCPGAGGARSAAGTTSPPWC